MLIRSENTKLNLPEKRALQIMGYELLIRRLLGKVKMSRGTRYAE